MRNEIEEIRDLERKSSILLDNLNCRMQTLRMKRTNLVLDEKTLKETMILSQKKTYSEAVMVALKEYIRVKEASKILSFQGMGVWSGNLSDMRMDSISSKQKRLKK